MKTLSPVTPAWRAGGRGLVPKLTTEMPARLKRRGYLASWPTPATVESVDGFVSDELIDAGVTIVWDNATGGLFRFDNGEWRSVSGHTDVLLSMRVGGYVDGYVLGF